MKQIINLFPSAAMLAQELGEKHVTVRAWRNRDSLPAKRDLDVVRVAGKHGIPLTLEMIAGLRAVKHAGRTKMPPALLKADR